MQHVPADDLGILGHTLEFFGVTEKQRELYGFGDAIKPGPVETDYPTL
jgi:hypothetical protein